MKKIVYLPLDERPCNYSFCGFLASENTEIKLIRPSLKDLGLKKTPADYSAIQNFLSRECTDADYLILAVDMLLYGGIVPSRLHHLSQEEIFSRVDFIRSLKTVNPKLKIFAFSLVMRCPTYSSGEEEPDYYETYGREIFLYGVNEHKFIDKLITKEEYETEKSRLNVPENVINDFVSRRKINLSALLKTLKLVGREIDEFIILQDDSNPFGYTSLDQRAVREFTGKENIKIDVHPGADEGGLTLLARVLTKIKGYSPKICPVYPKDECKNVIPLFEDREVYKSIEAQIKSAGAIVSEECDADIFLFCNLPAGEMRNIDNPGGAQYDNRDLKSFVCKAKRLFDEGKTVAIADIAYSNGGDIEFAKMLSESTGLLNLGGYAGWNTSSNTLGTVICQAIFFRFYGNTEAHRLFTAERVYEDISYCSYVRQYMSEHELKRLGCTYSDAKESHGIVAEKAEQLINEFTKREFPEIYNKYKISYCYMPWIRMFEIGLIVEKRTDA